MERPNLGDTVVRGFADEGSPVGIMVEDCHTDDGEAAIRVMRHRLANGLPVRVWFEMWPLSDVDMARIDRRNISKTMALVGGYFWKTYQRGADLRSDDRDLWGQVLRLVAELEQRGAA